MEINNKFIEYLNDKAKDFLFLLKPIAQNDRKSASSQTKSKFSSHHIPSINIDSNDILDSSISRIDLEGNVVSKSFDYNDKLIGFEQHDFLELRKFLEKISIRNEFHDKISYEFLLNSIFKWFKCNYTGKIDNKIFYDYLRKKINESVKKTRISIPIENLSIESKFKIGDIEFDFFSEDFFKKWEENSKNSKYVKDLKKKYQGKVIASISIEAEQIKCLEIAKEKVENSLILLRIFSPTILFDDRIPSYFGRKGSILVPESHSFIFHNEFPTLSSSIDCNNIPIRTISNDELHMLKQNGLEEASQLMTKNDPTDFEKKILNSLNILSRSVISNNFEEKMLFTLVSIETLLLKNHNEPIQSNIGRRLAYLISKDPTKRKEINDLIIKAYDLRSRFIHHGQQIVETEILHKTRIYIFESIIKILRLKDKIQTHQKLFEQLEKLTWS